MANTISTSTQHRAAIPPDDVNNKLTVANPDDPKMRHISVAGGTYTILVAGEETGGRYCLIDMLVPPGGGPPPHRHDFEEMFTILDGEIELTFRGEAYQASAGSTVNIPVAENGPATCAALAWDKTKPRAEVAPVRMPRRYRWPPPRLSRSVGQRRERS